MVPGQDGQRLHHGRSAHAAENGEDLLPRDQVEQRRDRLLGVVGVIAEREPDLAVVNAALVVGGVEGGHVAAPLLDAQPGRGPAEGRGFPEDDLRLRDAGFRGACRKRDRQEQREHGLVHRNGTPWP